MSGALEPSTDIEIELVLAEPERHRSLRLRLPSNSRVADALKIAGQRWRMDLDTHPVGIFGQTVTPDQPLKAHDRVELYRPLEQDAKSARRARASQQKKD